MIEHINLTNLKVPSNFVIYTYPREQFDKEIERLLDVKKDVQIHNIDGKRLLIYKDCVVEETQEVEKIPEPIVEPKINLIEIEELGNCEGKQIITVKDFDKFIESTWNGEEDIDILLLNGRRILISSDRIFQERDTNISKIDMQYV